MTTSTLLNIKSALARSTQWLADKGIESARLDAELLLAEVLEMSRLDLYLAWERPLDEREKRAYRTLLQRRARFEPVAQILGRKEFFSLQMRVTPDVLIPRPETELLVERTLELVQNAATENAEQTPPLILEVGAGSGAVAVALAVNLPTARILATDVSSRALAVAWENARAHDVEDRVDFRNVSLLDGVEESAQWVISNPPYVAERDRSSLPPDVVEWEPHAALFAGEDGLEIIRDLIPAAAERLRSGGWLVLEIGAGQAQAVAGLLAENGRFEPAETRRDYQGIERIVSGRLRT